MGPVSSPRYAWVLLDRALVHCRAVSERSHARRDALELSTAGLVSGLPKERRDAIDAAMRGVLKGIGKREVVAEDRSKLEASIRKALET